MAIPPLFPETVQPVFQPVPDSLGQPLPPGQVPLAAEVGLVRQSVVPRLTACSHRFLGDGTEVMDKGRPHSTQPETGPPGAQKEVFVFILTDAEVLIKTPMVSTPCGVAINRSLDRAGSDNRLHPVGQLFLHRDQVVIQVTSRWPG